MSPLIPNGSYMLLIKWPRWLPLRTGYIVKVRHPIYGDIVKQIESINPERSFRLTGTNPASISTEQMGNLKAEQLRGRVIWWSKPPVAKRG